MAGLPFAALAALGVACTYPVPDVAVQGSATVTDASVHDGPSSADTSVGVETGPDDASPGGDSGVTTEGGLADGPAEGGCTATVTWKQTVKFEGDVTSVVVSAPTQIAAGDLLLAYLTSSSAEAAALAYADVDAGAAWTPIGATTQQGYFLGTAILAAYSRVAGTNEPPSYAWTVSRKAETEAWILDFTGVSAQSPLGAYKAAAQSVVTPSFSPPPLATTGPGDLVITTFSTTSEPPATGWGLPMGTTSLASVADGNSMAGASFQLLVPDAGAAPAESSFPVGVTSADINTVITHIVALRACP
jgi:hypothetical protein